MSQRTATTGLILADKRMPAGESRLSGRWLVASRVTWLLVAATTLSIFVASIPAQVTFLQTVCPTQACATSQLDQAGVRGLHAAGLTLGFYAAYVVTLNVVFMAVFALVGAFIFWRRSDDRMALLASIALVTFGVSAFTGALDPLAMEQPGWRLPVAAINFLGSATFLLFLYVFPDARFVPRWMRWLALAVMVQQLLHYFFPFSVFDIRAWPVPLQLLAPIAILSTILCAQTYRYRRVSSRVQRQQTKWVVLGIVGGLAGYLIVLTALNVAIPTADARAAIVATLAGIAAQYVFLMLIPCSIAIALLRHRLFDVDLLINRALVYGALTGSVAAMYVLVVGSLSVLFQTRGNLLISLVATGVVAVAFQPLRERLQRGVNHLIYGQRDEPYAVLSQLGRRLETTIAPDAALPVVVETVARALKLPYAAIQLGAGDALTDAATYGTPTGEVLELPLTHQGERIGRLRLGARATGESWSSADLRLLDDLARQAGTAAHAVRLTADLQRSRERIVVAREETRRRLRRDLHDGLAPTLAALALKAGAIGDLIPADPQAAQVLSAELEAEIRGAIREIRRLVYELRPPTLDELGLVAAIRERAAAESTRRRANGTAHGTANGEEAGTGLQIVVEAPDHLPPLSAAVEVAAYRIVQEALTNVVRHAQAGRCIVRLTAADVLEVKIADDGLGLPDERRAGVGLLSMRERAEELGGTCVIEALPGGGTRVMARLPLLTQAPAQVAAQAKETR